MVARFAQHWDGAAGAVAQAETLRHRAAPLAEADAIAYENVLTALRMPKDLEPEVRDTLIGETLSRAADVPARDRGVRRRRRQSCRRELAECGNPNLRGDAAAASLLAAAAARVAANLVEINLATEEGRRPNRAAHAARRSGRDAPQAPRCRPTRE